MLEKHKGDAIYCRTHIIEHVSIDSHATCCIVDVDRLDIAIVAEAKDVVDEVEANHVAAIAPIATAVCQKKGTHMLIAKNQERKNKKKRTNSSSVRTKLADIENFVVLDLVLISSKENRGMRRIVELVVANDVPTTRRIDRRCIRHVDLPKPGRKPVREKETTT